MSMAETRQERVGRLAERARLALALGMAQLESLDVECHCFYPGGRARYVTADGKPVHQCRG